MIRFFKQYCIEKPDIQDTKVDSESFKKETTDDIFNGFHPGSNLVDK